MTIPIVQREVAGFLSNLAGGAPTETHISAVFIGSDTVWKLKKAVHLPYLDFSTIKARAHFLRRELVLNQPAAPGIYRDVVAISRGADGALAFADTDPLDWVLRMAPVPHGDFLDVVASSGRMTAPCLNDVADCVAEYHTRLPPVRNVPSAETLLQITEGNVASALAAGLPHAEIEAWHGKMAAAIEARHAWLTERSGFGFVRRCHGDLHLGNLCLWEGKPVAFDALEFDEVLATIDVGYDLAFLLMDLDQQVGRAAANLVMNRYVARTGDIAMPGFPIFLSLRAMIRAHVLTSRQIDGSAYLLAALTYLKRAPGIVIAIGGLQGTGKSTLARALAAELGPAPGAVVLRSDEIRKRLHHADPEVRLDARAYTDAANRETNAALIELAGLAVRSGQAVIVDATFLDLGLRRDLEGVVEQAGVPLLGVWLHAPLLVLEARVGARHGDASDATVAVLHQAAEIDPGAGDWLAVEAADVARALDAVRDAIKVVATR